MTLSAGTRLGPYEILGPIGAGGMGEVYRARDTRLGRDVAVKVLPGEVSHTPERLHRFEQEARLAGSLNHPNVLTVFDVGAHEGAPYLVTELLEGRSLREVLAAGPLPTRKVVEYAQQAARGLAAAHERGVVHRDLKPANVFVTKDGRLKILDFGLAKLTLVDPLEVAGSQLSTDTAEGKVVGTIGYMSPEQVRGHAVDARSDIFALGAVVYEMLSGRRAFSGDTAADTMTAILTKDPQDLSRPGLDIPSEARPHRPALPREGPCRALPVGQGRRLRPRGRIGHRRDRTRGDSCRLVARASRRGGGGPRDPGPRRRDRCPRGPLLGRAPSHSGPRGHPRRHEEGSASYGWVARLLQRGGRRFDVAHAGAGDGW